VHFNVPQWTYHALATVGGVGVLVRYVDKLVRYLLNTYRERHDESVWRIVMVPKYKSHHTQDNRTVYSKDQIPYSLEEIMGKVGRSYHSTVKSLRRLETRQSKRISSWLAKERDVGPGRSDFHSLTLGAYG
jgi:hypothetical protein